MNNIDTPTYGNPSFEHKTIIDMPTMVDALFLTLKEKPFPPSGSVLVKEELRELVDLTTSMQSDENETFLKRYKAYDRNLFQAIVSTFLQRGIDVHAMVAEVPADIDGLVLKLKYFYQRPRPTQLAQRYKLRLFPFKSIQQSPSYPSLNIVQAFVILDIIGSKFPGQYDFCKNMLEDITQSRCYLGHNYASDVAFSNMVAQEILRFSEFSKKYGI